MARVIAGGNGTTTLTLASTTRYFSLLGDRTASATTTEATWQTVWRGAGQLSFFQLVIKLNSRPSATEFTVRINGADTPLTISVPGGATGLFEDTANAVAIADGDLVTVRATTGTGGSGSITAGLVAVTFEADAGTSTMYATHPNAALTGALTRYCGFLGSGLTATEALTAAPAGSAGRISDLAVRIGANSLASATLTIRVKKNGVDTGIVITVAPGVTGWVYDLVNTADFLATDTINLSLITTGGGGGSVTVGLMLMKFDSVAGDIQVGQVMTDSSYPSASADSFFAFLSELGAGVASEVNAQLRLNYFARFRGLNVRVTGNAASAPITVATRKNGADAAQSLTVPIAGNGNYADTTHVDEFESGDLVDVRVSATTGDTTVKFDWMLMGMDASPLPTRRMGAVMMKAEGVG